MSAFKQKKAEIELNTFNSIVNIMGEDGAKKVYEQINALSDDEKLELVGSDWQLLCIVQTPSDFIKACIEAQML